MLNIGDAVPDFTVESDTAGTISSAALRGQRYVIYFYPKDDTPGCTKEACSFRDKLPDFQGLGVPVFGASADDAKAHGKFAAKYQLNFPLLADPDHAVGEAYGAWREKNNYGKVSMGIARSTYIIDAQGKVARVWKKVNVDGHDAQVLEALRKA